MSIDAKSGIEPVDGMPRRRKRTVSIRRFRVNSDGTKTLVCIIKPERGGSAQRQPSNLLINTDIRKDFTTPVSLNNSALKDLSSKLLADHVDMPTFSPVIDLKSLTMNAGFLSRLESGQTR